MAYQGITTGTSPNDGTGDSLLDGAIKINSNFEEIYNSLGDNALFTQSGTGAVQRTVESKLKDVVSVKDFGAVDGSVIGLAAYSNKAYLQVDAASTIKLQCNPTAGDNFQDMCNWISSGHQVEAGGSLYLELADGLHDVSTYVDLFNGQTLDIRGTGAPTAHGITAIAISSVGGDIYEATVTVSTALPNYVVAGYAIGCQNVKGNNGAESINGAHIISSIAADRLSFTFQYYSFGVAPLSPTTLDTTTTLGSAGCIVQVPKACLRANSAGWDGAAREGFINCLDGGNLSLRYVGIAFNGTSGAHDILFAKGHNSSINIVDRVVVAGAGSFVLRLAYGGSLYANRGFFGAGTTGRQILQGIYSCDAEFVRCFMGSASEGGLVPTVGCRFGTTQCVIASCYAGIRPTYRDSVVAYLNSRITNCWRGVWAQGNVILDDLCSIRLCTDAVFVDKGFVYGNPATSNNVNPVIDKYVDLNNDNAWYPQDGSTAPVKGLFHVKGLSTGQQVAKFETKDATTTILATFERGGGAVSGAIRYIPNVIDVGTITNHSLTLSINSTERSRLDTTGRFLIGTITASGNSKLQVDSDSIRVIQPKTPASATSSGAVGEIAWDSDYLYACTDTDTWKRVPLSTW